MTRQLCSGCLFGDQIPSTWLFRHPQKAVLHYAGQMAHCVFCLPANGKRRKVTWERTHFPTAVHFLEAVCVTFSQIHWPELSLLRCKRGWEMQSLFEMVKCIAKSSDFQERRMNLGENCSVNETMFKNSTYQNIIPDGHQGLEVLEVSQSYANQNYLFLMAFT